MSLTQIIEERSWPIRARAALIDARLAYAMAKVEFCDAQMDWDRHMREGFIGPLTRILALRVVHTEKALHRVGYRIAQLEQMISKMEEG